MKKLLLPTLLATLLPTSQTHAQALPNTTLNVPSAYSDINAAISYLSPYIIPQGVTATIALAAGHEHYTEPVTIQHPYGGNICIVGAPTTTQSITSTSVTGSSGNWSVELTISDSSQISVNDVVGIEDPVPTTIAGVVPSRDLLVGVWSVTVINDATHITVKNTTYAGAPLSNATGTLRIYPTQLNFSGAIGFIPQSLGCLQNVAIVGDGTYGAAFGVWDAAQTGAQAGTAYIGPYVAINGFYADGVRANYGGVINAQDVVSSNNGNNGFLARDVSHINCMIGCVASGNGVHAPVGGGNGYLSENTSSQLHEGSVAIGNSGVGFYVRSASSLLCGSPLCYAAYNYYDFESGVQSTLQNYGVGAMSYGARINGWYASNGTILACPSLTSKATYNSYVADTDGQISAVGAIADNQGASNYGFIALGNGTSINASLSSVTGTGVAGFAAGSGASVIMTGATGNTIATPTANSTSGVAWVKN